MLHKLRNRILFWFLAVTLLATLFILVSSYFIKKKDELNKISHELQNTQILILQDIGVQKDFFTYDVVNPSFYKTGSSEILFEHSTLSTAIKQKIEQISRMKGVESFKMDSLLSAIIYDIQTYNYNLDSVITLIRLRGYKTSGYEGQLNEILKKIENNNEIPREALYRINSYEKEYFNHGEESYVDSINTFIEAFNNQKNFNPSYLLNSYNLTFTRLAYIDKLLGLRHKEGMRIELDQLSEEIGVKFSLLIDSADIYERKLSKQLIFTYIIVGIFLIITSIIISLVVSKYISKPLVYLSSRINAFVSSKFTLVEQIKTPNEKGEIGQLSKNFLILRDEIYDYINYFKEKVEERTNELLVEKEKVENQKEEIEAQRDELNRQKVQVEKQKENILSSIRYASRIQDALITSEEQIQKIVPDSFLFQKPRDIVSGDFCFAESIRLNNKDYSVIALADCTGHGVPGAFMSILCYNYLYQIIKVEKHINPVIVLAKLSNLIYENLHSKNTESKIFDGLDISYLIIDNQTNCCEYAGAHSPMYLVRNSELLVFKGDKISIGSKTSIVQKINKHVIPLEKGDSIYLFSDGFPDQTGSLNGDKFKYKRFRELILNVCKLEFEFQKKEFDRVLSEWKGCSDQIDDITILGMKISSQYNTDLQDNSSINESKTAVMDNY